MTITVKLDPLLEEQLRRHTGRSGRSTSEVIRAALQAFLLQSPEVTEPSAYALGATLFGRHAGPPGLATDRKAAWSDVVAARQSGRRRAPPTGKD